MSHPIPTAEQLLDQIEAAFRGVVLGRGVSLHETEVLDRYGSDEERRSAREPDEKHDWRRLVEDPAFEDVWGVGGLSFYDAAGLRFHLPAYMCLAVKRPEVEVVGSLLFQLTSIDEYQRERLSVLTDDQRRCVREFLRYARQRDDQSGGVMGGDLTQAIDGYWSADAAGRPDSGPS